MSNDALQALPNVGPAVSRMLVRVGIDQPDDLRGQTAERLYERLCEQDGGRHDPCLLDTLVAVFDHANGAPPRPWWYYSRLRVDAHSAARYDDLASAPLRRTAWIAELPNQFSFERQSTGARLKRS